jgi:recombination associated protein RdgC
MFKNGLLYTVKLPQFDAAIVEKALLENPFVACGASQEVSSGWVPPRGEENGALLEVIGGQWIIKMMVETKKVPSQVLKRMVEEKVKAIEASTGRKPGKKEKRDIADDAKLELLPMAFATRGAVLIWIDPQAGTLLLDASTQSKADQVMTMLVKALEGIEVALITTQMSPSAAMAHWLVSKEPPQSFSVDRECKLKAADESKAVVKYGNHSLDIDEVANHIEQGKVPMELALTWSDRISLVITSTMSLKKITFLDAVFDGKDQTSADFDGDVAISTGELKKMLPDLLDALGGTLDGAQASAAAPAA